MSNKQIGRRLFVVIKKLFIYILMYGLTITYSELLQADSTKLGQIYIVAQGKGPDVAVDSNGRLHFSLCKK